MTGPLRLESSECRWCGSGRRVTPPPLHGVPGPAAPDREALEADGKELRAEAPWSPGGKEAVKGEGHGGGPGVYGRYAGRTLVAGRSSESAYGGGDGRGRDAGGR